jgi:hypothetical protein
LKVVLDAMMYFTQQCLGLAERLAQLMLPRASRGGIRVPPSPPRLSAVRSSVHVVRRINAARADFVRAGSR